MKQIDEMTYSELCNELDEAKEKIQILRDRKQDIVERLFALAPLRNASEQSIQQANG